MLFLNAKNDKKVLEKDEKDDETGNEPKSRKDDKLDDAEIKVASMWYREISSFSFC